MPWNIGGAEHPCHVCVPTTPPSGAVGWEEPGEAQTWAYEACSDNECSKTIGGEYGGPVFYKVGARAPAINPATNQESEISYYECTNDGWIAGDYDDPNAGGSGGGDDPTISCSAGYYAQTKTGPCVKCPSASFYNAEYEEETYVPLGNAEGTSKQGSIGIYSCYIASKYPYMDNKGVFKFTNDCYYGS